MTAIGRLGVLPVRYHDRNRDNSSYYMLARSMLQAGELVTLHAGRQHEAARRLVALPTTSPYAH